MKTPSRLVHLAIATSIGVIAVGGAALADPPGDLTSPPNHRHFIVQPDGDMVPVGPDICADPKMQTAFNQFHYNVHHQHFGAPGLHDGQGGEVFGIFGCG